MVGVADLLGRDAQRSVARAVERDIEAAHGGVALVAHLAHDPRNRLLHREAGTEQRTIAPAKMLGHLDLVQRRAPQDGLARRGRAIDYAHPRYLSTSSRARSRARSRNASTCAVETC